MKSLIISITILFLTSLAQADAPPVYLFDGGEEIYHIGFNMDILEDPTGQLTIDDVNSPPWSGKFKESTKIGHNFGFSQSAYWFKVVVENHSDQKTWFMTQHWNLLEEMTFFKKRGGKWESTPTGTSTPFKSREVKDRTFSFEIEPKESSLYFFRVKSAQLGVHFSISSPKAYAQKRTEDHLVLGSFFGLVISIVLYNLFIFFSTKNLTSFYYGLYVLFFGVLLFIIQGLSQRFLAPDSLWIARNGMAFFSGLTGIFAFLFGIRFLSLKETTPKLYRGCQFFLFSFFLLIPFSFIFPLSFNIKYMLLNGLLAGPYGLFCALYRVKMNDRPARSFLLSFSFMVLGIVINSLMTIGILPVNLFTTQAMLIGIALQLIVFSMALAYQSHSIQEDAPANNLEGRIHGLDAFRAVLMILGVVLHTVLSYIPAPWPYLDAGAHSIFLGGVSDFIHIFRMPAFFLISGFFGAMLWNKRGPKSMMRNRFFRLVLPFLLFVVILWPFQSYFGGYAYHFRMGVLDPLKIGLGKNIFPPKDTMHLWFLYYLIIVTIVVSSAVTLMERFSMSFSFVKNMIVRTIKDPWKSILLFGSLNFIWCIALKWWEIPVSGSWVPNFFILVYYIVFYSMGWILLTSKFDLSLFKNHVWKILFLGWVLLQIRGIGHAIVFGMIPTWNFPSPFDQKNIWEIIRIFGLSLSMILFIRGFIGLFLRYCNSGSALWRYISDASYWIFLVHLPIVFIVPPILERWDVHVALKFPIATLIVFVFCLSTYDFFVRSTFIGRLLNGRTFSRYSFRLSAGVSTMLTLWMVFLILNPEPLLERPSPWLNGQLPKDLLPSHEVTYPFVSKNIKFGRCAKVDNSIVCPDGAKFKDVPALCAKLGGTMSIFDKEKEFKAFQTSLKKLLGRPVWLAITDVDNEGTWVWMNGSELTYNVWGKGEPNNYGGKENCAAANWWGTQKWNDISCDGYYGFVCQLKGNPHDL